MLTVKDLILLLEAYPDDMPLANTSNDWGARPITNNPLTVKVLTGYILPPNTKEGWIEDNIKDSKSVKITSPAQKFLCF